MIKQMNPQASVEGRIPGMSPPDPAILASDLGRSLQLSRASALALTRLQLAMKSSDRHAAMAALDRLHTLDAEMERLVRHLPAPAADDPTWPEWDTMARHLGDQKLALAFEKLALASEISGPDLVSPRQPQDFHPPAGSEEWPTSQPPAEHEDPPPLAEWPRLPAVQPVEWKGIPAWMFGLLAGALAMVAVAAAVIAMAGR